MSRVGWCLIPPYVLCRQDMSSTQKLLFGRINGLTEEKGYCFASNEWLAEQIGISGKTVSTLVSDMKNKGLLVVEVLVNEKKEVIERRLYPQNKVGVSPKTGGGTPENEHTPLPENGYIVIENTEIENSKERNILLKKEEIKKYAKREDVTEDDFLEIADWYKVPLEFVKEEFETICLWEDEKPGRMRGRNWRASLMNWVRRDRNKLRSAYGRPKVAIITDD